MQLATASRPFVARPIPQGRTLDAILRLDEAHDGLLRFLLRASPLRRQGVYLALTQFDRQHPHTMASWIARESEHQSSRRTDPLAVIAHALLSMRVRDLLHAMFGSSSNGLLGALAKAGDDPLDETSYDLMRAIFDDPKNKKRADLLRGATEINDKIVRLAWKLPPAMLHPAIFELHYDPDDLDSLLAALGFIRRLNPDVCDEDIATSLGQMLPGATFTMWLKKWVERSPDLALSFPFGGDEVLRPLLSASDFKATSLRFKNCLRTKVHAAAVGRVCYYEYLEDGGAIAEVVALSGGHWVLEGIHGPQNHRPAPRAVRYIRTALEGAGVLVGARFTQGPEIEAVADILGVYDHGGHWLDLEDDIAGIAA